MPREWFELRYEDGLPAYVHSRTSQKVSRTRDMDEASWTGARSQFVARFPGAKQIRRSDDAIVGWVDCLPASLDPLFNPGDHLIFDDLYCGSPRRCRVAGVQMPLPLYGGVPSYILEDGTQIIWKQSECWTTDEGQDFVLISRRIRRVVITPTRRKGISRTLR